MPGKKVFDINDYESNDGMMTSVWGPALWHVLHTMSFNYPVNPTKEDKYNYGNYIYSLGKVLPCGACRKNLVKNLKATPLTAHALKNRNNFSRWMYRLHETVNKMLGKKSGLTYAQVRDRYEHFRARCIEQPFQKKIESGCTKSTYGLKSKCVLSIVPKQMKCSTFNFDKRCKLSRK